MTFFFVPVPGRCLNCSESPKSPNSPNHHAVDDHGNGGGASFLGAATAATHDVPHLSIIIGARVAAVLQPVLVGTERGRPSAAVFGKSIERGTKGRAKRSFLAYFRRRLMTWHPACLGEKPNLLRALDNGINLHLNDLPTQAKASPPPLRIYVRHACQCTRDNATPSFAIHHVIISTYHHEIPHFSSQFFTSSPR